MRQIVNINRMWAFAKGDHSPAEMPKLWNFVNLPHTWNALDGQDGGTVQVTTAQTVVVSVKTDRSTLAFDATVFM